MMIDGFLRTSLFYILVYICFVPQVLSGQETDFQTAWEAVLEKKLDPGIKLDMSLEQRFRENSLRYDRTQATFEAGYKTGIGLGLAAGARWILFKEINLEYINRFRIHADLNHKIDLGSFNLSLRSMFQYGFDEQTFREEPGIRTVYDRNRIELSYHFFGTKWTAQAGYELYSKLFNRENTLFCRSKTTAGIRYDINRHSSLNLSWLYDHEFNQANPQSAHMPGLSYSYLF